MNEVKAQLTPFTRREMAVYAGGCALLLLALFGYNVLTMEPLLTPLKLGLYGFFTLALILEYGFVFTHTEQAFVPVLLPMMLFWVMVEGGFMYGIIYLLGLKSAPYIFLLIFDGYTAATVTSRKAAALFTALLAAIVAMAFVVSFGARRGGLIFADHVVWIVLAIICAEIFVRQWRQRFEVERLIQQLKETHEQLRAYTATAEELAVTRERLRLACDLHDTVGHGLTGLEIQLALLARLPEEATDKRRSLIAQAQGLAKAGLTDLRRAVQALSPLTLETFSLPAAVSKILDDFFAQLTIIVNKEIDPALKKIDPVAAEPIFRAVQEACTNICRHAPEAKQVDLALVRIDTGIRLEISNDGAGDGSVSTAPRADGSGRGLAGMRKRAEAIDGSFDVSHKNDSFHLRLTLPLDHTAKQTMAQASRPDAATHTTGEKDDTYPYPGG